MMFADWIRWLCSMRAESLMGLALPFLMLDVPRYVVSAIVVWVLVKLHGFRQRLTGGSPTGEFTYAPSVCVLIAGHNEADTIAHTLESVYDCYPDLEVIVVDDGSKDGMADAAGEFARTYPKIKVLRRAERGGKSSALNFALPFIQSDVIVCLDADSHIARDAIWELVQPLRDPRVAGVSGNLIVRNPEGSLASALQALEYRRSIFLGRMVASRLDILGIISGAIGAYRTSAIKRVQGWDVGPGEDGDLALRLRKLGYRITFAPYATCYTNTPTSWYRLFRQRRRWDWAAVTFECRKHVDMINPFASTFQWNNAFLVLERWTFSVFLQLVFWIWMAWSFWITPTTIFMYTMLTFYVGYLLGDLILMLIILDLSDDRNRDLRYIPYLPLMPLYHLFLRFTTTYAVLEEFFTRRSFRDDFVPARVRNVTWHW
jgi:cellulose synthase/poly-beta-1,6-N-acetylglucosamine synthase-like glycosyltransferase